MSKKKRAKLEKKKEKERQQKQRKRGEGVSSGGPRPLKQGLKKASRHLSFSLSLFLSPL